jgi:hypothetical protein
MRTAERQNSATQRDKSFHLAGELRRHGGLVQPGQTRRQNCPMTPELSDISELRALASIVD